MPDSAKKIYIKDESFDPIYRSVNTGFYFKSRIMPGAIMGVGFVVLFTQVIVPLVFFKTQDKISKPVASSVLGLASGFGDFEFTELNKEKNTEIKNTEAVPTHFSLSIPKLHIENAVVETNSPSLSPDLSLGHYPGSALPGNVGNAFIYGHSVLPWFYNPKNYKTIFSTLETLEVGDMVYITYNNKELQYKVEYKEVLPTDKVNPLAEYKPRYLNESTITLMTCWPSGTKLKRLLVKAVQI